MANAYEVDIHDAFGYYQTFLSGNEQTINELVQKSIRQEIPRANGQMVAEIALQHLTHDAERYTDLLEGFGLYDRDHNPGIEVGYN